MKLAGGSDAVAASILRVSDDPSQPDDQVFAFCRSPQRFLLDLALRENPVATFKINGEPYASLSSPELIHAVLTGSMEDFGKGLPYDLLGPVFGEGLFNIDGQAWIDRHDDVVPFFSRRRIGPLAGTIADLVRQQIEKWEKLTNGHTIDLRVATKRLAFDVVRTGLLGIFNPTLSNELFDVLDQIDRLESVRLHYLGKRNPGISGSFQRSPLFVRLDQLLYTIVDERLASVDCPDDLIGASMHGPTFLALAPEKRRKFLRDLIATMLSAGSVPTGASMFWTLYLLARHPAVQARARAEMRSSLRATDAGEAEPGPGDRSSTAPPAYLSAVLNESLRLYPAGWFVTRMARKSMRLGNVDIPAGTRLICSPFVLHRMPAVWPDPEEFRPERFLPGAALPPRAFFPFGVGMRVCLGRALAMMEMSALTQGILSRFDVRIVSPDRVSIAAAFALQPREHVLFRLVRC